MKRTALAVLILSALLWSKDFFYVDYSCFKTPDGYDTITEIYISIPVVYLEFSDELESTFAVKLYIYDGDRLVIEDKWKKKYSIMAPGDKYSGAEIPVLSRIKIPSGYYKLVVEVEDLNASKVIDRLEVPQESKLFKIASFKDRISMSSIQLASKIITEDIEKSSEFFKNGIIILPNPSKIFGTTRPFIYFYSEIYGVEEGTGIEYTWKITDRNGEIIKQSEPETRKATGSIFVLADRAPVPTLKTGAYNMSLTVTDRSKNIMIEGSNNFYIYRKIDFTDEEYELPDSLKNKAAASRDSIELEIMKDDDIRAEFDQVFETLNDQERNRYSSLNMRGKREFLKRFWTEKGKNEREARKNFKHLVMIVNKEFSNSKTEGWRTDRGRVWLKMGAPDRRESETYNTEFSDHEIWTYFKGNYTFVFADVHGLGDFKLIHSDYPGEKYDPDWENKIRKDRF